MSGAAPTGRVAAGRKKLEEYKVKKKANVKKDTVVNNDNVNGLAKTVEEKNYSNFINLTGDSHGQLKSSNEAEHSFGKTDVFSNSFNLNSTAPLDFFDKFSNTERRETPPSINNDLILADVLFTAQNKNGHFANNEMQQTNMLTSSPVNCKLPETPENNRELVNNEEYDNDSVDEALSSSAVLKLQQQLQFHMQTVEFLVSEKGLLSSKVNELENIISEIKNHNNDLSGRLNISRQRASSLEVEYSTLKEQNQSFSARLDQALLENSKYKASEASHTKQCHDLKEELNETKSLLNIKLSENNDFVKKIEELTFHINSNELRIQQLSQGHVQVPNNQAIFDENTDLKLQLANVNQELKQLDVEKNQSNGQYQQYVQQLNTQLELMSRKNEDLLAVNDYLLNRESNLIQQMETLEKQLQSTVHVTPSVDVNKVTEDESIGKIKEIEEKNVYLTNELKRSEIEVQTARLEILNYKSQIEELVHTVSLMQSEQPDIAKLNAANESDRVAAQKATAQNAKLKNEIESLQEAYTKMTESKLKLVELLQVEKNLTKTLTLTLADNEENLKTTHSKLVAKDEEMIRLQAESSELEKEALKHAQVVDRLNHYETQSESFDLLQKELEFARKKIKSLTEENDGLKIDVNAVDAVQQIIDVNDDNVEVSNDESNENENIIESQKEQSKKVTLPENCLHIPTTEAMKKLQERFTKLMDDVANLSDDKQRLEHLVLQLQGETETICEYIALYQKQRSILKQREYEKDIQLRLLTQERQQVREQLNQLNGLVQQLVHENNVPKDALTLLSKPVTNNEHESEDVDTADKIINLLTEIKTNHFTESNNTCERLENFHPCPWCSGKLINI